MRHQLLDQCSILNGRFIYIYIIRIILYIYIKNQDYSETDQNIPSQVNLISGDS